MESDWRPWEPYRRDSVHTEVVASSLCDHGLYFDRVYADRLGLSASRIRELYPRLDGMCPQGCGFRGIAYLTLDHYVYGDW